MSREATKFLNHFAAVASAFVLACTAAGQYVDTTRWCISCHESARSRSDFCDAVPASVWEQDDKHRRAFTLLHESDSADPAVRAKKQTLVRQILGFDLREAFVDDRFSRLLEATDGETRNRIATVKSCLRCHGTWPKEADEQFVNAPPVSLELGVSCQACHGPGEPWLLAHSSEGWRRVTPEAKEALGCADCRSPIAKAKLCASCHVGNVAEEKFVKHEWYAAGHPPLPSFELASFQAQMPRHWKTLREKGPFKYRDSPSTGAEPLPIDQRATLERAGVSPETIKGSYVEANFPGAAARGLDPAGDLAGFRDVVVGGAVVHAVNTRLVGEYATLAAEGRTAWPELALYDCAACHHELRSGLASQTRPKRNHVPGRPPLATWPEVLTRLAARQTEGYEAERAAGRWMKLCEQMLKLDQAATRWPFGEERAMSVAANELAPLLEQLAADSMQTRFDDQAARGAIGFLATPQHYGAVDFDTARQAAWAIAGIANDVAPGRGDLLFSQGVDDPLALRLPSGPNQSVMENLRRWLPAASQFDPDWLRTEIEKARSGINAPVPR